VEEREREVAAQEKKNEREREEGRAWGVRRQGARGQGRTGLSHGPGQTAGRAGNPLLARPLIDIKSRIENQNEMDT
jgi:hypothetical protein